MGFYFGTLSHIILPRLCFPKNVMRVPRGGELMVGVVVVVVFTIPAAIIIFLVRRNKVMVRPIVILYLIYLSIYLFCFFFLKKKNVMYLSTNCQPASQPAFFPIFYFIFPSQEKRNAEKYINQKEQIRKSTSLFFFFLFFFFLFTKEKKSVYSRIH